MAISVAHIPASVAPKHLIILPGESWAVWKTMSLRSTGFPAHDVLQLTAFPGLSNVADKLLDSVKTLKGCRQAAISAINAALDKLREDGEWDDKTKRMPLFEARGNVKAGKIPQLPDGMVSAKAFQDLKQGYADVAANRESFRREFSVNMEQTSLTLCAIASSARFREAITWQNREALHNALDSLVHKKGNGQRSSTQRKNEELVASYVQRYSVKNDTIGFFGPVGWAEFSLEDDALVMRSGTEMLAARSVYFEAWPVQQLADVISKDRAIYPWLVPIRMPFISIENSVVLHPVFGPLPIPVKQIAVLQACDGVSTGKQISEILLRSKPEMFRNESEILHCLAELCLKHLLSWDLDIPLIPHPEQVLHEILDRIEDPAIRERALAPLRQLENARDTVAAAAGDPERLDAALENLELTFTSLTGLPPTRSHGRTYGGRTIVYEDCRRDIELRFGAELLRELAGPLTLLLISSRWLSWQIAEACRNKLIEMYEEISSRTGQAVINATDFWLRFMPYLMDGSETEFGTRVQQEFVNKWAGILHLESSNDPLRFSSEELRARVMTEFAAPRAGWSRARYHCPDIMIAATDAEAIRRGEYVFVLGEMHVALNTLETCVFVNQHPRPTELMNLLDEDLGTGNLVAVPPKNIDWLSRTQPLVSPHDLRLEFSLTGFARDRSKAVPISSLVIQRCDDEIEVRTADGQIFNALELAGWRLSEMIFDAFKIFGPSAHTPRISIDRLVVKRETWRFTIAELSFASHQDAAERFLQCRAWARTYNLPRFLFYKVPVEKKPAYLDLESPILADIFCRMVRSTIDAKLPDAMIEVTEMLPDLQQMWLSDNDGDRYSCELRIVGLDLAK